MRTPTDSTGAVLRVVAEPADVRPLRPFTLRLDLRNVAGEPLREFEVVHEQRVHLIIVREALDHFAHLHPSIDSAGTMVATYSFPAAGRYRLFADFTPAGGEATVAMAEISVAGAPAPAMTLRPNVPGKVSGDRLAAEVAVEGGTTAAPTVITFALLDEAGRPVEDLEPYLGAMGHLVILDASGTRYVHSHPLDGLRGGAVAFEVRFPSPGNYKGWGEFRRTDGVHVVPIVIGVR